jgi:ribosomal-protein-alanine N-acetyltransferase
MKKNTKNNLDIVEEINEEDVFLRKIRVTDTHFLYESLKNKTLTKYMVLRAANSLKDSKALIKKQLEYWKNRRQFNYIIESQKGKKNNPIGLVNIWNINWRHKRAELGIWIVPVHWHQGYGKKTIELIKLIAFHHLEFNRLEAHVLPQNKRSLNLFLACGFKKECLLPQYLKLRGLFYDVILLAILKSEL